MSRRALPSNRRVGNRRLPTRPILHTRGELERLVEKGRQAAALAVGNFDNDGVVDDDAITALREFLAEIKGDA